jgi:hypothetical protein
VIRITEIPSGKHVYGQGPVILFSEDLLAIFIELNEIADPRTRDEVESVFRTFLGDRPKHEDWKVRIHSIGVHYEVVVKGANQTRQRVFLDESSRLPDKIREWLELYPFR